MQRTREATASISSVSQGAWCKRGTRLLVALRLEVEHALVWNIADVALLSFGYAAGLAASRRRRCA
eukprot:12429898-Karenia_brevis.AAC.1